MTTKTHFPVPSNDALIQLTMDWECVRYSGFALTLRIAQHTPDFPGAQYVALEGVQVLRDLHRALGTALDEYDHARKELGLDEEPAINEEE